MVDTVASQPHFIPFIINLLASIESKDETRLDLVSIIVPIISSSSSSWY